MSAAIRGGFILVSLLLAVAISASAQVQAYAKREGGRIVSITPGPPPGVSAEDLASNYEVIDPRSPEVQRFADPNYSLKSTIHARIEGDPILQIIFKWICLRNGISETDALLEIDGIAASILPEPVIGVSP